MSGPAVDGVLLIPGAHHDAWVWDDLCPLLTVPCYAVTLPGRGGAAGGHRPARPLALDDLIAALVPDPGRCALDSWPAGLRRLPRAALAARPGGSLAPVTLSARRARDGLASDLDETQARRLLDRTVPETPAFLTSPMPAAALPPGLPRSYLLTRRDRVHKPRRQAAMAARLNTTVTEIDSGHDPMLSQPAAVASMINRAAAPPEAPPDHR